MLITVNGSLGSSPVNEKIRHQISRTDRPKIGVDSNSPITGFQADGLKKWERKTPPPFSQSCSEKGGEAGESGVPTGKTRRAHRLRHPHRLHRFHRLFYGRFGKLSALVALPSVDGAENVTRPIMVQCKIPKPMIMLSTGVGELTLLTETQITIGIKTNGDTQLVG